jgi:hypothetical protein
VCGRTSRYLKDVEEGYCGNCHAFTATELPPLPPKCGAEYQARQVADALKPALSKLDIPKILAGEPLPPGVRDMLFEGDGISLRRGTMFYGVDGTPIDLPPSSAMAMIAELREEKSSNLVQTLTSREGVPVVVSTAYCGVDLSTHGPLPLVWETVVVIGDDEATHLVSGTRYATMGAAHAGHQQIVDAAQRVVEKR